MRLWWENNVEVKLEYLGEDKMFPGAKKWKVEAIHVTTTRNQRKFTLEEQRLAARSLSFRPLNINHDSSSRLLPFPENCTEGCHFNEAKMAVDCVFRVVDPSVNAMIESGRIHAVSIEQIPTLGEKCDEVSCEQHGVAYIGMALLESHVPPGDAEATGIIRAESVKEGTQMKISNLIVSNEQRTCKDCTDFEACHTCKHKTEAGEQCMDNAIREIIAEHPDMTRDQVIAIALSKCGMAESAEASLWWYNHTVEKYPDWV